MLRFCVQGAYEKAVEDLKALLGLSIPKRSMEALAGEVSESVEAFEGQMVTKATRLKARKNREEMLKIIGYFEQNRAHMAYARYRSQGYPIGSGVVETAGKNLVRARMEQTRMPRKEKGAETILKLRAVF